MARGKKAKASRGGGAVSAPAAPAQVPPPVPVSAASLEAALERSTGAGGEDPRHEFDTNADILPATRQKGPSEAADPQEKAMSKRKKRKLEQLAQKRASQELRADVLKELQAVQLSPEQAALLRASQSTRVSKREQQAMVKRRLALGVPLTPEMERLQQKPQRRKAQEEEEEDNSMDAHPAHAKLVPVGSREAKAPAPKAVAPSARTTQVPPVEAPQPAAGAATAPAAQEAAAKATATAEKAEAEATAVALAAPPVLEKPVASAQRLQPERVQRVEAIEEQRSKLPAFMMEQEMVEMSLGNDVMLVCGETGCGKSTQVPQFLYEAGLCDGGRYLIGVTQPRRVAAISVSHRVGQELDSPGTVGYQVRYDRSHCTKDMRIKFMTDGILLREVQADFLCKRYAAIVIDEAHERGVNCDILIGLLSRAVQKRRKDFEEAVAKGHYKPGVGPAPNAPETPPPLRLIIMSATLRLCDFTENRQLFPSPPPVLRIEARTFPVTAHFSRSTDDDYIKAAHKIVLKVHRQLPPGTILVFVTGRHEVHRLCKLLNQSMAKRAKAAEAEEDDEESEQAEGPAEFLEASDDEGGAFDDELPGPGGEGGKDGERVPDADASKRKKKRRRAAEEREPEANAAAGPGTLGAAPAAATDLAGGDGEGPPAARRRKKPRKGHKGVDEGAPMAEEQAPPATEVPEPATAAEAGEAAPAEGSGKKKKKKRRQGNEAVAIGVECEQQKGEGKGDEKGEAEEEPECDICYRLDAEEDVVVLDPEAKALPSEDAKDFEAAKQKQIRMSRLDRSRTAGGVFQGSGFGEGPLHVLPLYAQLPARAQLAPFQPCPDGKRVVVVATNVAETSVTLPNVRYVVDTGREKRRKYRASTGISSFVIDRISKASADQRAGRAGRLGPGHTYRLFSSAAFENYFMQFAPIPMMHTPMDPVLLLLAFLGVPRLDVFPWPTPPSSESVTAAVRRLRALGAILDDGKEASAGPLTVRCSQLGFRLAALPVAPRYAKVLLSAVAASRGAEAGGIVGHACALVAALSVGNLACWESAPGEEEAAAGPTGPEHELERARRQAQRLLREAEEKEAPRWSQLRDDMDGLLWLMGGYSWAIAGGEEAAEQFCQANRVNARQISEAHSLMQQLASLLQRRLSLEAAGIELETPLRLRPPVPAQAMKLRECLVDGLVDRVAVACPDLGRGAYICADLGKDVPVFVHNSSNVFRFRPRPTVMVFNEIISSSKPFMRDCIGIDPVMLARRAATGECPLLKLGDFLAVPAPRYLKQQDKVLAFASPRYTSLDYSLPTVEVPVPSDSIFRYKVFAKALLEGEVLPGFPQRSADLLARPSLVLHAPTNPRVSGVVGPLWERRVGSHTELLQCWAQDSRFLLEGYLKWLPPALHTDVRITWPPASPR